MWKYGTAAKSQICSIKNEIPAGRFKEAENDKNANLYKSQKAIKLPFYGFWIKPEIFIKMRL